MAGLPPHCPRGRGVAMGARSTIWNSMAPRSSLSKAQEEVIRISAERGISVRTIAKTLGASPGTVARALARGWTAIPDRVRKAADFAGVAVAVPQQRRQPTTSWSLETIRNAGDGQSRGDFAQAVKLAEAMRTDDALFTAYHARLAPQASVEAKLVARNVRRGGGEARSRGGVRTAQRARRDHWHHGQSRHCDRLRRSGAERRRRVSGLPVNGVAARAREAEPFHGAARDDHERRRRGRADRARRRSMDRLPKVQRATLGSRRLRTAGFFRVGCACARTRRLGRRVALARPHGHSLSAA